VVSVGTGVGRGNALFANPFKEGAEEALGIATAGRLTYLRRVGVDAAFCGTWHVPRFAAVDHPGIPGPDTRIRLSPH
jgi:hypothetical protein